MSRQQKRRIFRRMAALMAAAGVLALPIDWLGLGKSAALVAAGLRQPMAAAGLLESPSLPEVEIPSGEKTSPQAELPAIGDTTIVELPVVAPLPSTPPITMVSPPGEIGDGGRVIEKTMDTGDTHKAGIATINRSGTAVDVAAALERELTLSFEKTDAPQVLILHTHTTDS